MQSSSTSGVANATRATKLTAARSGQSSSQPVSLPLDLFTTDGQHQRIDVEARIASNNQVALQHLCEHGLGIALLARADALASLQRGALVQVLAPWRLDTLPVWAVTPRRDGEEAKVRAALDYLKRHFASLPGATG